MTDVSQVSGLTLAVFDPSNLGILAFPTGDGDSVTPVGPGEVLRYAPNADAAIDGPMFDTCAGADYASATCDTALFLQYDAQRNISLAGSRPNDGILIAVVNGAAMASHTIAVPDGASVAVQLYPTLVDRGSPTFPSGDSLEQRAALAIMEDGRLAFAIGSGSMSSFSQQLANAGAVYAGYTDGGGSTHLVTPAQTYGASEQRRVATWLVSEQRGGGVSALDLGVGLLLIGAAGTLLYLVTRKR